MASFITLHQFETIDGLFRHCLHARPSLEQCLKYDRATATRMYFTPEWKLLDACIEAIGYDAANAFPSTIDCAASILTDAMLGKLNVVDGVAA